MGEALRGAPEPRLVFFLSRGLWWGPSDRHGPSDTRSLTWLETLVPEPVGAFPPFDFGFCAVGGPGKLGGGACQSSCAWSQIPAPGKVFPSHSSEFKELTEPQTPGIYASI